MFAFFRCVAEAVVEKGFRGLVEMIPGGSYALDVGSEALKKLRHRKKDAEIRAEIQQLAQANFEEARRAAAEAVKEAVPASATPEDRVTLELYLSQVPGAVRASQKRPDDPSGKTLSAAFALATPDDVVKILPGRPPRFKPNDPVPGLAGWHLVEPLGSGGFGEVWLARHRGMSSLCGAVKFCHGQQARDLKHESGLIDRVMSAGRHPNIVPLTNAHLEGDAPWLMYEYVPGGDLADLIREWQKLPSARRVAQVVTALRQLATAVSHFHRLSPPLVHRDLKPSNILVDRTNKRLRITDFGIGGLLAKASLEAEANGTTTAGERLLHYLHGSHTPLYASVQQRNGLPPDTRDDVHAIGVIGYQLLTGQLDQGAGPDFAEDLREQHVPDVLIDALGRCVASKTARRPQDAAALEALLGNLAATLPKIAPVSAERPPLARAASTDNPKNPSPEATTPVPSPVGRAPDHDVAPEPPPVGSELQTPPNIRPDALGTLPFPSIPMGAYKDRVKWHRQAAGCPSNGSDVVYLYRELANGKGMYFPLFALPPDVLNNLLAGVYKPEESRLFIHLATKSGTRYEELAPAAAALVDAQTGLVPLTAPRRGETPRS